MTDLKRGKGTEKALQHRGLCAFFVDHWRGWHVGSHDNNLYAIGERGFLSLLTNY
ncbi:MAG: hypothetical protein V5A88_01880 [Candidatus Thermoplasmatota archaeon]